MKTSRFIVSGVGACLVLVLVEVAWFVVRLPRTLDAFGGPAHLVGALLPRAVGAGVLLAVLGQVAMASIGAWARRSGRTQEEADFRWAAIIGLLNGGATWTLLRILASASGAKSLLRDGVFAAGAVIVATWVAYAGVLIAARVRRWVDAPGSDGSAWTPRRVTLAASFAALAATLCVADRLVLVRLHEPLHVVLRFGQFLSVQCAILLFVRSVPSVRVVVSGRRRASAMIVAGTIVVLACAGLGFNGPRHDAAVNALRLNGAIGATLMFGMGRIGQRDGRAGGVSLPELATALAPAAARPDLGGAAAAGANILLITVDALRADHLGAFGYGRATSPNIDRLVDESVTFERAYTSAPHTSFALTSLLIGHPAMSLAELNLLDDRPTLADFARANGYQTAASFPPAVFFVDAQRFKSFDDRSFGFESVRRESLGETVSAIRQTDQILDALSEIGSRRFFVWAHYFGPHEPYVNHPEMGEPFGGSAVDRYDGEIRWTDGQLGRLIDTVRTRYPRTIIVLTADHGEEFGEHGGAYHGTTLYDEQVRVPLLFSIPGVSARRITLPVSTTSVLPSLLALAGIPADQRFDGVDLTPWILPRRSDVDRDLPPTFVENASLRAVIAGDDKLICDVRTDTCALFDLARDRSEEVNAAVDRPTRARQLREMLESRTSRLEGLYGVSELWQALTLRDIPTTMKRSIARRTARLPEARWANELRARWSLQEDPAVKAWLAAASSQLGDMAARAALPGLVAGLPDPDPDLVAHAALARDDLGGAAAEELSTALARGEDVNLRCSLMRALVRSRSPIAGSVIIREYDVVRSRICAAEALVALRDRSTIPFIVSRLQEEPYTTVQAALARALGEIGDKGAIANLRVLRDSTREPEVSRATDVALSRLERLGHGT